MAAVKIKKPGDQKVEEPPYTPFIDIIFQILIFFMLAMKFNSAEGQLVTYLPKDKGLFSSQNNPQPPPELRIYICGDGKEQFGGMKWHIAHKWCGVSDCPRCHELRLCKACLTDWTANAITLVQIAQEEKLLSGITPFKLPKTKAQKDTGKQNEEVQKANEVIYTQIGQAVKHQLDTGQYRDPKKPDKMGVVKIDACGGVPVEHFIGVLNALYKMNLHKDASIEYSGNPAFADLFQK